MGRGKRPLENKKYVTVSIPTDLIRRIDLVIQSGTYGYDSRAELIKDAIRKRLGELEKERI